MLAKNSTAPPPGMVLIPEGEFLMGSPDSETDAKDDEKPEHTVHLDGFFIDTHPVTNAEYQAFIKANPAWGKYQHVGSVRRAVTFLGAALREKVKFEYLYDWDRKNNYPKGEGDRPVTNICWMAAMAYAAWAGKRLPTEAEWEKAARGGNVGVRQELATAPNAYGLYMGQPMSEWCFDAYDGEFYKKSPRDNPLPPGSKFPLVSLFLNQMTEPEKVLAACMNGFEELRDEHARVVRGGWLNDYRIAQRGARFVGSCSPILGFRCVRAVTPNPST